MQVASPKQQIKRYHHKSRTGCSTCKRRRLKCDERRPACLRCVLANKECEYNVPQARTFPPQSGDNTPSPESGSMQLVETLDESESRALAYFKERALQDITGFTSHSMTFWTSLIPQLCHTVAAVRHIAIAISSKHEALGCSPDKAEELGEFCVKHHSLALQLLTNLSLGCDQEEEILLVSCIAFILFERLNDPYGMAGQYLDYVVSGLKILRERGKNAGTSKPKGTFNLVDHFLEPMFIQIELAFSMFCQPERIKLPKTSPDSPDIPKRFEDLDTASEMFFRICVWRYLLSDGGPPWTKSSPAFSEIHSLISRWNQAFDAFLLDRYRNDEDENRRVFSLRQQICPLIAAMMFSIRDDAPVRYCCEPLLVDLSNPSKIHIYMKIYSGTKINLSGINAGVQSASRLSGASLWPRARRLTVQGVSDSVLLEFSTEYQSPALLPAT